MTQQFLDAATLTSTKLMDDGSLLVEAACARTGCQKYLASEIGLMGDEVVNVFRPETVVFDAKSMASYAGRPVTVGHPKEPVTSENWKDHAVGEVQDEVVRDGDKIKVTFRVRDASAIKAIESGTREISMGYSTPIDTQDGTAPDGTAYQAVQIGPIEINHLAIVDEARGGKELRIGDGAEGGETAEQWGAAPITDQKKERFMSDLKTVVLGDKAVKVTPADEATIEKFKADQDKVLADTTAQKDGEITELKGKVEGKDGEVKALEKKLADATSPKTLADMAKKRSKAMAAGKKAGMSEEEMEDMDDAAIKRAVVAKDLGDEVKDMSDEAVDGAFKAFTKTQTGDAALGGGIERPMQDHGWGNILNKKGA